VVVEWIWCDGFVIGEKCDWNCPNHQGATITDFNLPLPKLVGQLIFLSDGSDRAVELQEVNFNTKTSQMTIYTVIINSYRV